MKTFRFLIALTLGVLGFFAATSSLTSCQSPPDQRTQAYRTLAAVGGSAKAGLDACALLLKNGQMTLAEWSKVSVFYTTQFQPAFALAVQAAQSNLSSLASPDLVNLASQFAVIVASYTTRAPTPSGEGQWIPSGDGVNQKFVDADGSVMRETLVYVKPSKINTL